MPSFQVTLTDAATNYRLVTLVRAIDSAYTDNAKHLSIQAEPANTDSVLLGDSSLSTTRYGSKLGNGEGKVYGDGVVRSQSLGQTYARSASAGQKLNIEVK
jgi:hypothetical protein